MKDKYIERKLAHGGMREVCAMCITRHYTGRPSQETRLVWVHTRRLLWFPLHPTGIDSSFRVLTTPLPPNPNTYTHPYAVVSMDNTQGCQHTIYIAHVPRVTTLVVGITIHGECNKTCADVYCIYYVVLRGEVEGAKCTLSSSHSQNSTHCTVEGWGVLH